MPCEYLRMITTQADPIQSTESNWLTRVEIAAHYQVSVRTIDSWTARNLVPFRKLGARVLFNIEKVEAALSRFDRHAK